MADPPIPRKGGLLFGALHGDLCVRFRLYWYVQQGDGVLSISKYVASGIHIIVLGEIFR